MLSCRVRKHFAVLANFLISAATNAANAAQQVLCYVYVCVCMCIAI